MELVYLWVEEYKNIYRQGFNFSPRFECEFFPEYDENKKLKDDCELKITPKDYVSIFPDNINITAIVGENGSGKSSVIKVLKKILDYIPYTELGYTNSKQEYPYNFILVVNINDERQYISSFDFKSQNTKRINVLGHYNYYLYLAEEQQPSNEEYKKSEIIAHRFSIDKHIIANMLISQYVSKIDFKLTTFMFLPAKITIKPLNLYSLFAELTSDYEQGFGVPIDFKLNRNLTDREEDRAYKDTRNQSWAKKDDLDNIFNDVQDDFHRFLIIWYIKEYGDDEEYKLNDKEFLLQEYKELQKSITEDEFIKYFKEKNTSIDKFKQREKEVYFNYCKEFFEFDFVDSENRNFNDLSHGEQTIFSQFLNIYYFSLHDREKIFIYMMDEPDLSLHPQWQKNYFFELYNLLDKIDMTYQVLITTHSPFILSDLPKENVIFLKNGKSEMPDIEQTFGANIHTLLSHGFFMENGLMGEFAKEKINEVIKLLNPNSKRKLSKINQKFCEHIISIIGEPILKKTLEHQFNEKLNPNETELQKLQREQEEIKAKIAKLTGKEQ